MFVTLREILDSDVLGAASPVVVAGESVIDNTRIRWVHSSEIIEIASLLSGGELLLTGGNALLALKTPAQVEYLRSLVSRKIAALAIETAATGRHIPDELIAEATAAQLPLIELRDVVPFVEVAETINRKIVTEHIGSLQIADELSLLLTDQIASTGTQLQPLLNILSSNLNVRARVSDTHGGLISVSGPEPETGAEPVVTDLPVGGIAVAQLELIGGADREQLETVLSRVKNIVALAISQRQRPSLTKLAEEELMNTITMGGGGDRLVELCQATGVSADLPVVVTLLRRGTRALPTVLKILREHFPRMIIQADDTWLSMLLSLPQQNTVAHREQFVQQLRTLLHGSGVTGAVGPMASTIRSATESLTEAKKTWRLGQSSKWNDEIYDSSDFVIERLAELTMTRAEVENVVDECLGELISIESRYGGELVRTLDVWLSTGCNTAETARQLFVERQSLHKRLNKIFAAIGGDPRGRGKLSSLTIAVKLVRGNAQLRDST